jgi:hypothetical protein
MAPKRSELNVMAPTVKDKQKALKILSELLSRIDGVKSQGRESPAFTQWQHEASVAVANIFGEDSLNYRRFSGISYSLNFFTADTPDSDFERRWKEGLEEARAIMKSLLEEIRIYWDEPPASTPGRQGDAPQGVKTPTSKRVFIVHGHNDGAKEAAARLLEKLELEPVILHEQPNRGRTIIEKFEAHADVAFAIVLLTADDDGKAKGDSALRSRARQNVILELGFFLGRLGRTHVCALYEDGVEVPSDYSGVLFVKFDGTSSWMYSVAKEMRAAGLNVDLNKI